MRMRDTAGRIGRRSVLGVAGATLAALAAKPASAEGASQPASPQYGAIHLPARDIPPPESISPQARAYLAERGAQPYVEPPPLSDLPAWKRKIAAHDQQFADAAQVVLNLPGSTVETRTLKGDLSRGLPPTYLRTGVRDLLLSDTVRMHAALRKAGVAADLYVGEAMPHSGLGGRSPEDADAREDTQRWLQTHWRA